MPVSILKQRDVLIASVQAVLTDEDLRALRDALVTQVGTFRLRGVIVDVTAPDVMDSFAARTLRDLPPQVPADHDPPGRGQVSLQLLLPDDHIIV